MSAVDIGIRHAALGEVGVGGGDEADRRGIDRGIIGRDLVIGGRATIDGPRQSEGVRRFQDRVPDADGHFASGAPVHMGHAAFKTFHARDYD